MKKIVIIGAGSAGITVAARLKNLNRNIRITIIDPASMHYYQPLWTLVGGGATKMSSTGKTMSSVIPDGVNWLQQPVKSFNPEKNIVATENETVSYDYLVVCPGIQLDWNKIEGLEKTLGKNGVSSNYSVKDVEKTWEFLQNTNEGTAIFTFPNTPIKCAGAPQKIMYLAEEHFRNRAVRNNIKVEFVSAGESIFGVTKYKEALEKVIADRGIETAYQLNLTKVDGTKKIAYFENVTTNEIVEKQFSFLHVTPPMSAPDFVKNSPLVNETGWIDVDKYTLQHNKYKNVFSLGDASSLPTSKTGAAIRKEAPVLVKNLVSCIDETEMTARYDGYTSCPLVTGYGKLILAEFDYDKNPVETFPFNQAKERLSMYLLKKHLLPKLYWFGMLKGKA